MKLTEALKKRIDTFFEKSTDEEIDYLIAKYCEQPIYFQVVKDTRKLGMQEISNKLNTLSAARKELKDYSEFYDDLYIIARL